MALRGVLRWLFKLSNECERIFSNASDADARIATINALSPGCACEKSTTSKYSPRPVEDEEVVARFVFDPIHISRNGDIKTSLFSHVHHKGCSVQRDTMATPHELEAFVASFLERQLAMKPNAKWHGVVTAPCKKIRAMTQDVSNSRSVCVFDTAEPHNQAHAELFQTQYVIDEADQLELRKRLMDLFSDRFLPPHYRNGEVLNSLKPELRKHCRS